uniref:Uncharacterized protein n=1 Tax=Sphaerodactylus townsendi TaxID=933632 RepID=A0ACB8EHI3_9SAUR
MIECANPLCISMWPQTKEQVWGTFFESAAIVIAFCGQEPFLSIKIQFSRPSHQWSLQSHFAEKITSQFSFWLHSSAAAAAVLLSCIINEILIENILVNTFHTVLFCTRLAILLVNSHNLSDENEQLATEKSPFLTSNEQNSFD